MGYRLKRRETAGDGIRRIACEQIDRALAELADEQLDRARTIHQVRKRCKKLRGLIRLVRPALGSHYRKENACFRDAARLLSGARDAKTTVAAFDQLLEHYGDTVRKRSFDDLRQCLTSEAKTDRGDASELDDRLREFESRLRSARRRIGDWPMGNLHFDTVLEGLKQTYGRGCRAMEDADAQPTAERFHQWRKRVKYHGYHLRVLEPMWASVLKPQRRAIEQLADCLGDDHDLAVLRDTLGERCGGEAASDSTNGSDEETIFQTFAALLDRRREELQMRARPLGQRIFAEKPKALAARIAAYRQAWQSR